MPASLLRRETEEFDILHALLPPPAPPVAPPGFLEASSSGSWTFSCSGSSPQTPVQAREVAVDEDGFEVYDPAAFEGSVTREDFVPDEVLDTVTCAVQARSEEQDRLHREQEASKAREKGKAVVIYVDDDSEEE